MSGDVVQQATGSSLPSFTQVWLSSDGIAKAGSFSDSSLVLVTSHQHPPNAILSLDTPHGPPSPPVNVEITSCHGNTAELQWEGGPENWATVTRYIVQFNSSVEPVRWHDYYEQFPAGSRRALVVLSPWGTYSFRVKAVNDVGVSKPSSVTSRECTTPPDRPDSNPKNVRTRTDVKNTLVVEWNPIDRLYFNGPGFRYDVYWRRKGSLAWEAAVVHDPLQTQFRKEVTDVYGLYEVQVRAANDLGESHQPAFVFIGRSGEAEPLVVPKDFRLNPNHPPEAHKAYFIWEAVNTSTDLVQGKFCGYKIGANYLMASSSSSSSSLNSRADDDIHLLSQPPADENIICSLLSAFGQLPTTFAMSRLSMSGTRCWCQEGSLCGATVTCRRLDGRPLGLTPLLHFVTLLVKVPGFSCGLTSCGLQQPLVPVVPGNTHRQYTDRSRAQMSCQGSHRT
ncbi:hypothetical protein C0Q70_15860 [Pomacea canaliculata]|uniref:Fibronectin type-III domain-containing protein n=1 Tax=Pomacea canaliculata TaxID=400727 RepID=A0A2T7NW06_POMCA|nr:hypothetical protein C0Q70_15860 [Pomacea canaliculata]